jgi:hypothetical protein
MWLEGSASNNFEPGFIALAASAKNVAADGHFVHDGESNHQAEAFLVPVEGHGRRGRDARLKAVGEPRLGSTSTATTRPLGPNEPGKFESEEPHAGAGLKHGHSGLNEWFEDARRILPELAHGARKNVTDPPWTDAMLSHDQCSRLAARLAAGLDRDEYRTRSRLRASSVQRA